MIFAHEQVLEVNNLKISLPRSDSLHSAACVQL